MVFQNIGQLILSYLTPGQPTTEKTASESYTPEEAKKISEGLAKVASFPCKEEVYTSVQGMMKIASDCLAYMTESLNSVQERNTGLEKVAQVRLILDDLIHSGLVSDDNDAEEKIAELMKKDEKGLEVIKEAIKLAQNGEGESLIFEKAANDTSEPGKKGGMFDGVL